MQEIRGYEQPTRLANAPPYIKGVLNLRGVIVTVVLNVGGRKVGAVVDSESDVIELTVDQIKPPPEFSTSVTAGYIVGIGVVKLGELERTLIPLDIEQLMTSFELGLV